ncbi:MAG: twin-arginine translocase TatA/TatE family subunit [Hahellaceae bacterium]|jgi:sec-independent protein translocase protein TatA|nr:twin-arginine translocase TatA/TatE family subunit [Hahellaceae bacterium]
MGGISVWQLLIIFAIIILLFGTKKLRNLGSDLGGAVKGFKKSLSDEEKTDENTVSPVIDNPAQRVDATPPKTGTEQPVKKENQHS